VISRSKKKAKTNYHKFRLRFFFSRFYEGVGVEKEITKTYRLFWELFVVV